MTFEKKEETLKQLSKVLRNSIFPVNVDIHNLKDHVIYQGLTKREYFAAMAMQGLISNLSEYVQVHQKSSGHELIYPSMDTAVIIADALIAELNK